MSPMRAVFTFAICILFAFALAGCSSDSARVAETAANQKAELLAEASDKPVSAKDVQAADAQDKAAKAAEKKRKQAEAAAREKAEAEAEAKAEAEAAQAAEEEGAQAAEDEEAAQTQAKAEEAESEAGKPAPAGPDVSDTALNLSEDYRAGFDHGEKGAAYQRYIVLHDTEGEGDAASVIDYWDGAGSGVAAHFVVNKDGSVVQCVPLDRIAHHAGFGDTGHNALFGVEEDGRDDKVGVVPIGDWAADYGMNSYSIGIEMVHMGGSGGYPEAQLAAVDAVIARIDAHYGFQSTIIDHKGWRSGNSDTSPEFAEYLANYQDHRTHN